LPLPANTVALPYTVILVFPPVTETVVTLRSP
jgi:hypothetical protein